MLRVFSKILVIVFSMPVFSAAHAGNDETCQPWVSPNATIEATSRDGAPVTTPKPVLPDQFKPVRGGIRGTPLIFLGDSLTAGAGAGSFAGSYPRRIVDEFGKPDRKFEIYAIGGRDSTFLKNLFQKERIDKNSTLVVWVGRNNDRAQYRKVVKDTREIIRQSGVSRYLVLSVLRGRAASEQPGQKNYLLIKRLNQSLRTTFGEDFIDVGQVLKCSDRVDNVHLNSGGYAKIARKVFSVIEERGW